jgi:hypothetical protein
MRPFDVAAYIERLQSEAAAPRVKQELAAIRGLSQMSSPIPTLRSDSC